MSQRRIRGGVEQMAFDRRGYYYRSYRDGDRVHRVYLGKGLAAQLSASTIAQRWTEAAERSQACQAWELTHATAQASLDALDELADWMMQASLMAAGYHRHDRGSWRKRRMHSNTIDNHPASAPTRDAIDHASRVSPADSSQGDPPPPQDTPDPGNPPQTSSELRQLLDRARQGDRTALPALQDLLDERPQLWRHCGDVGRVAQADWIDLIAGHDLLTRQSLKRQVEQHHAELAGPEASPLERLLIERIVCCWMQVSHADSAVANLKGESRTIAQLDLMQKRQERTQRSYLAAIKALATVRKLITPTAAPATTAAEENAPERGRQTPGDRRSTARNARTRMKPGKPSKNQVTVPRAIRDRIKGMVGTEN